MVQKTIGLLASLQSRFRQEYELRCNFDYVEARFSADIGRGYIEDTVTGTEWDIADISKHRGEWPNSTATLVTFDREDR